MVLACGGSASQREIVEPRDIAEGSDAPSLERVVDLGDLPAIPARGTLPTDRSDGILVVGELLLIEGEDFGKLPAVEIGGRPTETLARTGGGGIVCRIPTQVPGGKTRVEVAHPGGRGRLDIEIRRYALVASAHSAHAVQVNDDGSAAAAHDLGLAGVSGVAISRDGQAGYLASNGPSGATLTILAMAAAGGPKQRDQLSIIGESLHGLVTGPGVAVLAALGDGSITVFDARVPTAITEAARIVIPGGAQAAALDPEGHWLAVLSGKDNQLTLIDLGDLDAPKVTATLSLMPTETVPLVRAVQFAPGGTELLVLAGDNRESTVAGSRPTTLHVVSLDGGQPKLTRSVPVGLAAAPISLSVAATESTMAATAVRSTRKRAAMVVSTAQPGVLGGAEMAPGSELGQLLLADLDGNANPLAHGSALQLQSAISHDRNWVLSATRKLEDGRQAMGLMLTPLERGKGSFLELASEARGDLLAPLWLAVTP